ncbi:hypothetical protein [Burkholderia cepacia]|uniref:hypothetical protein n=1 Tax=Burkholderia cepacia TaxID=292 RepID=UPI003B573EAC
MFKQLRAFVPIGAAIWLLVPPLISLPLIFVQTTAFYDGHAGEFFELPQNSFLFYGLAAFVLYYGAGYALFIRRGRIPGSIERSVYLALAVLSAWPHYDLRELWRTGIVLVNRSLTAGSGVERHTLIGGRAITSEGYAFSYAPLHSPQEARILSFGRWGEWNSDHYVKCFREHTGALGLAWANDLRDCPEGTPDDVFTSLRLERVGQQGETELASRWPSLRDVSNPSTWSTVQGHIAFNNPTISGETAAFAENSRFAAFSGLRTVFIVDKNSRAVSYIPMPDMPCIGDFCNLQGVIDERSTLYICAKPTYSHPYDCQYARLSS